MTISQIDYKYEWQQKFIEYIADSFDVWISPSIQEQDKVFMIISKEMPNGRKMNFAKITMKHNTQLHYINIIEQWSDGRDFTGNLVWGCDKKGVKTNLWAENPLYYISTKQDKYDMIVSKLQNSIRDCKDKINLCKIKDIEKDFV
jgi:hypothetical protein